MKFKKSLSIILLCALLLTNVSGVFAQQSSNVNVASITAYGKTTYYTSFEAAWGEAYQKSQTNSVKMTLYHKWIAGDNNNNGILDNGEINGDFVYAVGTESGALIVPEGADITIDLNGYSVNRGHIAPSDYFIDSVFYVRGSLTIEDGSDEKTGVITCGGFSGVTVWEDATFTFNSGNIAMNFGYGIYIREGATLYMNGGCIRNNDEYGICGYGNSEHKDSDTRIYVHGGEIRENSGAIYAYYYQRPMFYVEIKNTLIENNHGAPTVRVRGDSTYPYTKKAKVLISNTIIRNNSGYSSGGVMADFADITIIDSLITQNHARENGAVNLYRSSTAIARSSLTLGGSTRIVDNYLIPGDTSTDTEKTEANIYIEDEKIDLFYDKEHPFTENALIGITSKANDNEKLNDKNGDFAEDSFLHFFADQEDYAIISKDAGSGEGKDQYRFYYSKKSDKSDIRINTINVKDAFACNTASLIDSVNRKAIIYVKKDTYKYAKSCRITDIAELSFAESGTTLVKADKFADFTTESPVRYRMNMSNSQYGYWDFVVLPEGGEWIVEDIGAASVSFGDTIRYFPDFESAWVYAIGESKVQKTTLTLYRDWLGGDANSNGVIDEGETAGAFLFYKDGTEYGSEYGALHLATDSIDMVINLNGYKIDRGLTTDVSDGHVIRLQNGASLEIRDDSLAETGVVTGGRNGLSGNEGGAVYIDDASSFTLTNGSIINNVSEYGGAVYIADDGSFTMNGGKISSNSALQGGAIATADGSFASKVRIYGGEICNNTATGNGGGIYFAAASSSSDVAFVVENAKIYNNEANLGGGIFVTSHDNCTVYVRGNAAIYDNVASYGGGVYLDMDSRMSFENCRVEGNRAYITGGGVTAGTYSNDPIVGGVTYIYDNYVQSEGANAEKTPSNFYLESEECNINNNSSNSISEGSKIGITIGYDKESDCFSASGSKFTATSHKYFWADLASQIIWDVDSGSGDNRYQLIIANIPEIGEVDFDHTTDGLSVSAEISGKVYEGVVIVAGYNENSLVDARIMDYDDYNGSATLSGNIDKVKVMLWKDFIDCVPITSGKQQ